MRSEKRIWEKVGSGEIYEKKWELDLQSAVDDGTIDDFDFGGVMESLLWWIRWIRWII